MKRIDHLPEKSVTKKMRRNGDYNILFTVSSSGLISVLIRGNGLLDDQKNITDDDFKDFYIKELSPGTYRSKWCCVYLENEIGECYCSNGISLLPVHLRRIEDAEGMNEKLEDIDDRTFLRID